VLVYWEGSSSIYKAPNGINRKESYIKNGKYSGRLETEKGLGPDSKENWET
jgi:hypothetical protein